MRTLIASLTLLCLGPLTRAQTATKEGAGLRDALIREAAKPGKRAWQPMLLYLADLHGRSVLPAIGHLKLPYQSIGPGYQNGAVFGHIDLTHERLDTVGGSLSLWPNPAGGTLLRASVPFAA